MMKSLSLIITLSIACLSCSEHPMPKPNGYPRLNLPVKGYINWNSGCHFNFKRGISTEIEYIKEDSCFFNISYPSINAKIHCSYLPVNNHLKEIIDQEYKLREKHNQFSTSVQERVYHNEEKKVNALLFNISGTQAATPLQFFITDSIHHFFRGTLYFNNTPNNDSLYTAIEFIREDVDTLIESFDWK